ncbi:ABC transporter permease [Chitinophagaceae bacterium LWZ2-11]
MFKNYLKTTLRILWRNKTYSFLNIFGLAIGIACAGLIFIWVENEVKYDSNHLKKNELYFVDVNSEVEGGVMTHSSTPGLMGPAMQAEIPGIANTCRSNEDKISQLFNPGNNPVYASGRYMEPSVFNMFTLPFVEGNAHNAFSQLYSLVITEKTAKKFFGNGKNIIGKSIRVDNKQDYIVTGVLKDLPENSSLQFEWLAPFEVYYQQSPWTHKWGNYSVNTYVELKPGVDPETINKQLYNYLGEKNGGRVSTTHPFLFSMNDWRLYDQFDGGKKTGGGRIEYVRLFSVIAWIILLIACVNFMNLATARSEKRAREVGVRKVLGAGKGRLITQFMGEALFMSLVATLVAVVIMALVLPAFNILVHGNLTLGLNKPMHFIALFSIALICGLIAGSYPALYLSSFNPVFVLKGIKLNIGSAAFIRKGLVVLQFSISIVLIIGTMIIYQQIQYVKNRNLGFNKSNLIQMDLKGDMDKNFTAIKQDLINTGVVENVALTDHETIYSGNNTTSLTWDGKNPKSLVVISQRLVSPEFISTVGMQVSQGRDFQSTDIIQMGHDLKIKDSATAFSIVVTESLEKLLGKGSAIGKEMQLPFSETKAFKLRIVGVVKDYVYGNMYGKSDPVVFYCWPAEATLMYVRTKANASSQDVLAKLEGVMKQNNPSYPFEYRFVDDQFNQMFSSEMLISKLSRVFAVLAIMISCLGLFGLAAYTAERRIKEIGIRKVLGASVAGLAKLLSKDFLQLVVISCFISFPIAGFIMHKWLADYAYRININWWIFAIAGIAALLIAMITVSFQAVKAAMSNPIKNLRTE